MKKESKLIKTLLLGGFLGVMVQVEGSNPLKFDSFIYYGPVQIGRKSALIDSEDIGTIQYCEKVKNLLPEGSKIGSFQWKNEVKDMVNEKLQSQFENLQPQQIQLLSYYESLRSQGPDELKTELEKLIFIERKWVEWALRCSEEIDFISSNFSNLVPRIQMTPEYYDELREAGNQNLIPFNKLDLDRFEEARNLFWSNYLTQYPSIDFIAENERLRENVESMDNLIWGGFQKEAQENEKKLLFFFRKRDKEPITKKQEEDLANEILQYRITTDTITSRSDAYQYNFLRWLFDTNRNDQLRKEKPKSLILGAIIRVFKSDEIFGDHLKNLFDESILSWSIRKGDYVIFNALMESGEWIKYANDTQGYYGEGSLCTAAIYEQFEMLQTMIECDKNAGGIIDKNLYSKALMEAALLGRETTSEKRRPFLLALIDAGADVNYREFGCRGPLNCAVSTDAEDAVLILLEKGALVNQSIADEALKGNHQAVLELLREAVKNGQTSEPVCI